MAYETITNFTMIQTFYADPEIVSNSSEIGITSIDLFFKSKPDPSKNASGKPAPGVSITICEVQNDEPQLSKAYYGASVRKSYDEIYSFSDASTPTSFGFTTPLKLKTGRFYGVVIIFDDPSFEIWVNKQGDRISGTNTPSPGTNIIKDGKLYNKTNAGIYKAISDTDLKFAVNVAKYISNTSSQIYVNRNYEFLDIESRAGSFLGGEWVYQETANAAGTISVNAGNNVIIGTGTSFSSYPDGGKIVVYGNTTQKQVYTALNIVNNTYMTTASKIAFSNSATTYKVAPVGKVYYKDNLINKLYLVDSTANTTLKFANGAFIEGVDSGATANITTVGVFSVDRVQIKGDTRSPAAGKIVTTLTTAIYNGSIYTYDPTNNVKFEFNNPVKRNLTNWDAYILSRSLEVDNSNLYSNVDLLIDRKSFKIDATLTVSASNTGLFLSPSIEGDDIDMYVMQNKISNTYLVTDANTVSIDSEVNDNGAAISRHITKKVTFANNRFAEDVRMFMTAYRPSNTDLKIYTRIHNSQDPEAFDDKAWTPLEYMENGNKFSSREDKNDLIEYELGLSQYSESANVVPGTFTTQTANAIIVAEGVNPTVYVAANDLVKLYNPLIPEDYIVAVVSAANSTTITLGDAISNNNVLGTGFKVDRLKYYHTAFNNITNDNVARYYNSSLVEFDTFDSMQIKIVFTSDSTFNVPEVDQIQVIGVSA